MFFLDDASRFGLGVVVGTDETAELFLRGLHLVLRRFGFMSVLFLDRGPGFRADDTAAACRRLDIHLALGTAAYPEGHGKIEKFGRSGESSRGSKLAEKIIRLPGIEPTPYHASAVRPSRSRSAWDAASQCVKS